METDPIQRCALSDRVLSQHAGWGRSNRSATEAATSKCVIELAELRLSRNPRPSTPSRRRHAPTAAESHFRDTSDVDDDPDLVTAGLRRYGDPGERRGLDDGAEPMASRIDRLADEAAVDNGVRAFRDGDVARDESFDLVNVEALVDPRGQE